MNWTWKDAGVAALIVVIDAALLIALAFRWATTNGIVVW